MSVLCQNYENELCQCNYSVHSLIKICLNPIANILLNNYTKVKNNEITCSKKRKMSTVR